MSLIDWGDEEKEKIQEIEIPKISKPNPFDIMRKCITTKQDTPLKKELNSFLTCTFLSGDMNTVEIANLLNSIDISNEAMFNFLLALPPMKGLKYPSNKKPKITEDEKILMKHYNINGSIAREYKQMLPNEELKRIKSFYSEGKKGKTGK